MSRKNGKKSSGDPRKRSTGRVTPKSSAPRAASGPPNLKVPPAQNVPTKYDLIDGLDFEERLLLLTLPKPSPLATLTQAPKPVPPSLQPYRIEEFETFNPIYDGDPYFEKLRQAFAREMKLLTVEYYPSPEVAIQVHKEFIERMMSEISVRLPELAMETSGIIEQHFRSRFKKRGQSDADFEKWDREILGGFFADNVLMQRCLTLASCEYYDEIENGAMPLAVQNNHSYTQYGFEIDNDSNFRVLPMLTISSKLVNKALNQGYSVDEIIEGIIQKTAAHEVLNIGSRSNLVGDIDNLEAFQLGLTRAFLESNPDGTPGRIGGWGHNALIASLHVRLNPIFGVDYRAEAEIFEILSRTDPSFFERVFEACFAQCNTPSEDAHLMFAQQLKIFGEKMLGDNYPEIKEELEAQADLSLLSDVAPIDLQLAFYAALATDPQLTKLGIAIQKGVAGKSSDHAFFAPPGMLRELTR